ncbi:MAG: shikimate kinase [Mariprofundaceae bacterium]|nr:shikimate kinase [Mariprofundaceae bacterium]
MKKKPLRKLEHPVLIGLMGCGKSSIGRRLRQKLKMPLLDLDDIIVREAGMSIPDIFAGHGEDYFRNLESNALASHIGQRAILATGGGIVMRDTNRRLLKTHPPVIWLKATPEFIASRIAGDPNRPLLANQDTLQRLTELAEKRYPLYGECADLVIDRESMNKDKITELIIQYLKKKAVA